MGTRLTTGRVSVLAFTWIGIGRFGWRRLILASIPLQNHRSFLVVWFDGALCYWDPRDLDGCIYTPDVRVTRVTHSVELMTYSCVEGVTASVVWMTWIKWPFKAGGTKVLPKWFTRPTKWFTSKQRVHQTNQVVYTTLNMSSRNTGHTSIHGTSPNHSELNTWCFASSRTPKSPHLLSSRFWSLANRSQSLL